ncbi:MAG: hypothetical protein ACFCAD_12885 [Pleurocapsa sp.]
MLISGSDPAFLVRRKGMHLFDAEVSGGVFPTSNFASSCFYFRASEDQASITLQTFDETTNPEIEYIW